LSILDAVANTEISDKKTKGKAKRPFAGFKHVLLYADPSTNTSIKSNIRRVKVESDAPFKVSDIRKVGPTGGSLKWGVPEGDDWAVWERLPEEKWAWNATVYGNPVKSFGIGPEAKVLAENFVKEYNATNPTFPAEVGYDDTQKIAQAQIRYLQAVEVGPNGGPVAANIEGKLYETLPDTTTVDITKDQVKVVDVEVSPFEATETFDINKERSMDDCGIDPEDSSRVLGTLIKREKVYSFAPDTKKGSTLEQLYTDDQGLSFLANILERENLAGYFPLVKRAGITTHLATMFPVTKGDRRFMLLQCFAGEAILDKPIDVVKAAEPEVKKPIMMRPTFKKKVIAA
jgi:hypothetical protein